MESVECPPELAAPAVQPENSIVHYEQDNEVYNSQCQITWSNIMDKGRYGYPSTYERIEALLLCWESEYDDLAINEEVQRFESLLRDKFNYNVDVERIGAKIRQKLQVQVNARVANYLELHDGPKNLIIVYYAGHGKPGDRYGYLELFGQTSPNQSVSDLRRQRDKLIWNKTENILKEAAADVLQIFDCCYAGNVDLTRGDSKIEYLGATGPLGTTPVPGETSFTSALIFAMEALLEQKNQGRFTTGELLKKIIDEAPKFVKTENPPQLSIRSTNDDMASRIMLHPLQKDGSQTNSPPKDIPRLSRTKQWRLKLYFDFDDKPSEECISRLGTGMNSINETHAIGLNSIRWGGIDIKARLAWRDLTDAFGRKKKQRTLSGVANYDKSPTASDFGAMVPTPVSVLEYTSAEQGTADQGSETLDLSSIGVGYPEVAVDDDSNLESETSVPRRRKKPRLLLTPGE